MGVVLNSLHYIYVLFIIIIVIFMVRKKDTILLSFVAIMVLGLVGTGSLYKATMGLFVSLIYATVELLPTILIIAVITAMGKTLDSTRINEEMVAPFKIFIKNDTLAYWIIGIFMMVISWFFWPSPACALMGALFLPLGKKVGLPAMGVAVAMNLFGHGIALSSDLIIQAAPKLTSSAAGITVAEVNQAIIPLEIVMGVVTTVTAFYFLKRDMKRGMFKDELEANVEEVLVQEEKAGLSKGVRRALALMIVALYALDIFIMSKYTLQGGDATALIGGTTVFILAVICFATYKVNAIDEVANSFSEGLSFGIKIFGFVIPIAAFFYLGDSAILSIFGEILPEGSNGLVNDLGVALAYIMPISPIMSATTLTVTGAITGLDGSGFSGIPLVGSVANLFAANDSSALATLTALGQLSGIWVGGGTCVPWSVIAPAAICGLNPFDLAARNIKPVVIGLVVTTIFAMFLL